MIRDYGKSVIEAAGILAVYLSVPGVQSTKTAEGLYQLMIDTAVSCLRQLKLWGLEKLV